MTPGATKLRTGVVLIADEVSLRRLGPTTALAAVVERTRLLTCVDELVLVTDSESVRGEALALGVACLRWQDVGPAVWAQTSRGAASPDDAVARGAGSSSTAGSGEPSSDGGAPARPPRGSGWPMAPSPSGAPPSPGWATGTAIVPSVVGLSSNDDSTSALWLGLGLDAAVFVDVACPLWDTDDLQAVIVACGEHSRAFLAAEVGPAWAREPLGTVNELQTPVCVEMSTLRGYRLRGDSGPPRPIVVSRYKGWSLRDPVERLGIEAAWARNTAQQRLACLPERIGALVMDFDGVHTDNRVYVNEQGIESVVCNRGDGLGLEALRKAGVPLLVISKERNSVVSARCDKLQIPCLQGVDDKLTALQAWAAERDVRRETLIYVGNDVNDLECLEWAGCAVAVADSHPDVLSAARLVLEREGGAGALRELCELILLRRGVRMPATTE